MTKKKEPKICIKCKKPESKEIFFAVNKRTKETNRSCEKCLNKTRKLQRKLQEKIVKERKEAAKRAEKPWDHIPWPATLH